MSSSRSRQGTDAQLVALIDILEQNPEVARGHIKTACARKNIQQFWERVAPSLNNLGGATKTKKQWMKYWTDKKLTIKKKAAERAAARRRTGGGVENIRELTEVEERVLQLLGGEGYAVGDQHLQYDLIQHSSENTAVVAVRASAASPSILPHICHHDTPPLDTPDHDTPAQDPHTSAYYGFEPVSAHSPILVFSEEGENRRDTTIQNSQSRHQPGSELAPSPIRQSSPRVSANLLQEEPRRQPPSQRRSQMTFLSERFLRIEERRLTLEEKQSEINLIAAQAQRDMAGAIRCLGDGNHAVAAAVRDGVSAVQAMAEKYFS